MAESASSPRRVAAAETRRAALQLRKAGASFTEIALQLGYSSKGSASNAVHRELRAVPREAAADLLALELARLDDLLAAHWAGALAGDTAATRQILAVMDRRARYLGLDSIDQTLDDGISLIGDLMKGIRAMAGPPPDDPDDDPAEGDPDAAPE
jgi:AraC-like DNA-binding protein